MEHHFIETNGVTLHVVEAGKSTGPLVLLLHGFPEFWYGWRRQIPALAQAGFRVWAPDQRGYNLSDKPQDVAAYAIDNLALDIVGLIDAAGANKAYIAGHDWGAAVAWWLALHHPTRVARLVILNVPHPAVFGPFLRAHRSQQLRSWYMLFFQLPRAPEWMLRHLGKRSLLSSSRPGAFSDEDLARYQDAWKQPGAATGMINWYRAARRQLTRAGVTDPYIDAPVHIIWGEEDAFLDKRMASLSLEYCRNGQLTMLPGITHWVQHEAAPQVNDLLIRHFKSG